MNTQKSSLKSILAIVIIIAVAAGAYFYYEGSATPAGTSLSESDNSSTDGSIGIHVLSLLNQIKTLKIDTSLFSSPAYQSLRDYTVAIPQVSVGRANPFAPLPGAPAVNAAAPKR